MTPAAGSPERSERQEIEADITLVVGGHFTPDALSPEVYGQLIAKLAARSRDYVAVFRWMFLGQAFDAVRASRLHLPTFLQLVAPREPEAAAETATDLLRQYDAVMIIPDELGGYDSVGPRLSEETARMLKRIEIQRAQLRSIAGR
jgi:hypothetical protein